MSYTLAFGKHPQSPSKVMKDYLRKESLLPDRNRTLKFLNLSSQVCSLHRPMQTRSLENVLSQAITPLRNQWASQTRKAQQKGETLEVLPRSSRRLVPQRCRRGRCRSDPPRRVEGFWGSRHFKTKQLQAGSRAEELACLSEIFGTQTPSISTPRNQA